MEKFSTFTSSENSLLMEVSQDTAELLAGQFNAMRINQNEHLDVACSSLLSIESYFKDQFDFQKNGRTNKQNA